MTEKTDGQTDGIPKKGRTKKMESNRKTEDNTGNTLTIDNTEQLYLTTSLDTMITHGTPPCHFVMPDGKLYRSLTATYYRWICKRMDGVKLANQAGRISRDVYTHFTRQFKIINKWVTQNHPDWIEQAESINPPVFFPDYRWATNHTAQMISEQVKADFTAKTARPDSYLSIARQVYPEFCQAEGKNLSDYQTLLVGFVLLVGYGNWLSRREMLSASVYRFLWQIIGVIENEIEGKKTNEEAV